MDTITVDGKLFKAVHISTQKSNLLAIYGSKGFLACRYTSLAVANKLGEAVAIVTGVKNYDDMLKTTVIEVSTAAHNLGISKGDSGISVLMKLY